MGHFISLATLICLFTLVPFVYSLPFEPVPEYVYVKEFEDVSLKCPVQQDEWSRPNDGFLPLNHKIHEHFIHLPNFLRNSSGKYVCYRSGIPMKEFIVDAEFPPELTLNLRYAREHDGSPSQNYIEIICSAYASPPTNPKFFFNGEVLMNNTKFKISAYPPTQFHMENQLLVSRDSFGDKDILECHADNKMGSSRKQILVILPTDDQHPTPIENKQNSVVADVLIVLGTLFLGCIFIFFIYYYFIKNRQCRHCFRRSSKGLDGQLGPQQVVLPDESYGNNGNNGGPDPAGSPGTVKQNGVIGPAGQNGLGTAESQVALVSRITNESAL